MYVVVSHHWLRELLHSLNRSKFKLEKYLEMAQITQAQIDAVTAELTTADGTIESLNTTAGQIETAVQALEAANPGVDLSGLTGIAAKIGTDAGTLATSMAAIQTTLNPPTAPAS